MTLLNYITTLGFILEIAGVLRMANKFLSVRWTDLIKAMIAAPFGGRGQAKIAKMAEAKSEDTFEEFKGLSFLFWGFSLQFIAFVLEKIGY